MDNQILEKANYCLNCKIKPCSEKGCPLHNNIPDFIQMVKKGNLEKAYEIVTNTNVLPSVCGRICPQNNQCRKPCIRGIKGEPVCIGDIEAYIGDYGLNNNLKIKPFENQDLVNKKIAIIGGGPAGLSCAAFLRRRGAEITIYEKYDFLGGLLIYGIPEFRLPKDIVNKSINKILKLGINVKYNQILGENLKLEDLEQKYDNIVLAFGGNITYKMGIEGENLDGVYGGNELFEKMDYSVFRNKIVVVNGGGDVAMDVARTAKRNGAKKVIITYRRSENEMPADIKEINSAKKDGVEFMCQTNIVKILGENKVQKLELVKTKLVQELGKRPKPVNIENSNFEIEADIVAMALGSHPEDFVKNLGLDIEKDNCIKTFENGKTSNDKIYAIGNLAGNIKTVAWACASAKILK